MLIVKSIIQPIAQVDRVLDLISDIEFFSEYERSYCLRKSNPIPSLSGIWCVKAAFSCAIRDFPHPAYRFVDVQIRHDAVGRPWIEMSGVLDRWQQTHNISVETSISHTQAFAAATVLLYSVPL